MKDCGERWEGKRAGESRGTHLFPLPMVQRAITISNYYIANYPAGAPAEERVIYEGRGNKRLRQIVLLIDSDQNTTVVLIIVQTATLLILDGRL